MNAEMAMREFCTSVLKVFASFVMSVNARLFPGGGAFDRERRTSGAALRNSNSPL
jgi:hypothetical protein